MLTQISLTLRNTSVKAFREFKNSSKQKALISMFLSELVGVAEITAKCSSQLLRQLCKQAPSAELTSSKDKTAGFISELSGGNIGHYLKADFTCNKVCNKVSHSSASSIMGSKISHSK